MDSTATHPIWIVLLWLGLYGPGLLAAWHALNNKRHSNSAFGWIVICLLIPLLGPGLYFVLGVNRVGTPDTRSRHQRPDRSTCPSLMDTIPTQFHGLVKLGDALTGWPAQAGNQVVPLYSGEQAFEAMLKAIDQAKHEVLLSTYIFETNKIGHAFAKALAKAKHAGAEIHLLVDGIGEHYSRPRVSELADKFGLTVHKFHAPTLFPPSLHLNLRNHRKILVVDNHVAFTGGMNIGERYLASPRPGTKGTQDTHFRCQGPVVRGIRRIFQSDWHRSHGTSLPTLDEPSLTGDMVCRVIADGPGKNLLKLQLVLQAAINSAQRRIAIMTPYFVPPDEIVCALQSASLRGVTTQLMLPSKSNLPYVSWATQHMISQLTDYGVEVLLQPPPFAHDKMLLIDEHYALVGSANLDYRSLRLNFEIGLEVFSADFNQQLTQEFERRIALSKPLDSTQIESRSRSKRLRDGLAWLAIPYL